MIKLKLALLCFLIIFTCQKSSAQINSSTNPPAENLKLFIEPSSTPVPSGTAKLSVGLLKLKAGTFLGDYQVKVVPYFFQNEKGKLSIAAPEASLAKLTNQVAVDFVGKATSSDGTSKRIDGKITPSNRNEGTVCLWFMAGKRKMIFNAAYRFVD